MVKLFWRISHSDDFGSLIEYYAILSEVAVISLGSSCPSSDVDIDDPERRSPPCTVSLTSATYCSWTRLVCGIGGPKSSLQYERRGRQIQNTTYARTPAAALVQLQTTSQPPGNGHVGLRGTSLSTRFRDDGSAQHLWVSSNATSTDESLSDEAVEKRRDDCAEAKFPVTMLTHTLTADGCPAEADR